MQQTDIIKDLCRQNLEIEGLLHLLGQRPSDDARQLLSEKFSKYAADMQLFLQGNDESNSENSENSERHEPAEPTEPAEPAGDSLKLQEAVETEVPPEIPATSAAIDRERNIKLDEMLSRRESADLRKAFTLNDKYRFRRELFGGSDSDFNHTLDLLMHMDSYDEACRYLLGDLCWDEGKPEVEDFLTIVKRHFQA